VDAPLGAMVACRDVNVVVALVLVLVLVVALALNGVN
jgi:hypothetical protein